MALTQDETVAAWHAGILRVDAEHGAVEHSQDVGSGKVSAGMTQARCMDHPQTVAANVAGHLCGGRFGLKRDRFGNLHDYAGLRLDASTAPWFRQAIRGGSSAVLAGTVRPDGP